MGVCYTESRCSFDKDVSFSLISPLLSSPLLSRLLLRPLSFASFQYEVIYLSLENLFVVVRLRRRLSLHFSSCQEANAGAQRYRRLIGPMTLRNSYINKAKDT